MSWMLKLSWKSFKLLLWKYHDKMIGVSQTNMHIFTCMWGLNIIVYSHCIRIQVGMLPYSKHFWYHNHFWPLDWIERCFIKLLIVSHPYCHIKYCCPSGVIVEIDANIAISFTYRRAQLCWHFKSKMMYIFEHIDQSHRKTCMFWCKLF